MTVLYIRGRLYESTYSDLAMENIYMECFYLPYDVGPARDFLGEAEKTPQKPHYVWF